MKPENRALLERIIAEELVGLPEENHNPELGHPLTVTGFGAAEVFAATETLISTFLTMGAKTREFEKAWAQYCGRTQGIMVNSGSSANLLMLGALIEIGRLQPGDEVLVPAVAWSTSLFPIFQVGLVPVLVDVDPQTLCIDPHKAARAMSPKTRAVLAVHLLGQPVDPKPFEDLGLIVLEDACAAHGGALVGASGLRPVGSLGLAAAFSFFFSHHITTIEGGIIVTDDAELADAMRSLRAHGWTRERSDKARWEAAYPEIDPRFLFVSSGYNLRPTEVQAVFGLEQLKRLPAWVEQRRRNHAEWCERVKGEGITVFPEAPGTQHAGFAFAMLTEGPRAPLMRHLEAHKIETRPISGSNLARQPAFRFVKPVRVPEPMPVSDAVHERGFFVGNSHAFGADHGDRLGQLVDAWRQNGR